MKKLLNNIRLSVYYIIKSIVEIPIFIIEKGICKIFIFLKFTIVNIILFYILLLPLKLFLILFEKIILYKEKIRR